VAARIRKYQLKTLEIIVSIKPSAPSKMISILLWRYGKKYSRDILKDIVDRRAAGKASACFKLMIHVPECIMGDLSREREDDQLRNFEFQPQTGCVGEPGPFVVRCNMRGDPAVLANQFNETSLVLVEQRGVRIESCRHVGARSCCLENSATPLSRWESSRKQQGP
jgi:hypothetical protein